ncbi:hypothetical protein DFH08DRAFT_381621 [Mycena albidolilacea]|uniref:Uncharacterized protein n=1 Tax=Mycena albidolilacea TaxID=1033008 RepID=A0AAD7AMC5_9AGAR|nr:hypothetical protein DFH08DRAFT_381621 [Mycena albidolilacea]
MSYFYLLFSQLYSLACHPHRFHQHSSHMEANTSVLPTQPEQPDGGAGGDGAGLVVPAPVVHINDTAKIQLRWLDTTTFCQKYGLGDEICQRLIGEKNYTSKLDTSPNSSGL